MINFIADAIFSFFSRLIGRLITDIGLKFVANKALIYTFLTVTFPIVIKNMLCWLMDCLNSVIQATLPDGDIESFTASLTGLAGWLGEQLLLPTCISILLSAIAIRFVLNFIPFIG